ncbi:STAM-binding protein-like [Biomphalaria glabrata]|uniref:STAM-binding protein-like n=1 Tax=Biomphalaria glabrata TaxID=6526 RepID=A0A9U8DXZ0_BIOGL|nr:STAM-binding protein-like [Biomphalaria glabrata]
MSSSKLRHQTSISSSSVDPNERIKLLIEFGSKVEVDNTLAVKLYLRSGREMLRMANMFCDDGQLESAFILYYKFIILFVEKLPLHQDYKHAPPEDIAEFKRKVKKVFPIAEIIKAKLKDRYAEEEKVYLADQKRLKEEREKADAIRKKALEEQEKQDAALAKKLQEEEEAEVRTEQEEKYLKLRIQEEEKLKEKERRKQEELGDGIAGAGSGMSVQVVAAHAVADTHESVGRVVPNDKDDATLPPPPSYSEYLSDISTDRPQIPDRELKKKLVLNDNNVPIVDRSCKPNTDHHLSLGEFGGLGFGQLRTIVVPSILMSKFLTAAEINTVSEAETMGILCGKMAQGKFHVTTLFIPKQKGGHDSCDMENEEELIFYQDEKNLITLGWIHTHPTQTAFLSSVDLHSHFPWQKMMPEAIAIVCSPKFQENGIFKLTDHGLNVIGSCKEKGFHPHSKDPPLFEICNHVEISLSDSVIVEDRRK